MDKVRVRLGWRRTQDGDVPRMNRPDKDGREWPGSYLFFKQIGVGRDATFEYLGEDAEEDVVITPSTMQRIKEGHLLVVDPKHPLASLYPADPSASPKGDTSNKKNKASAAD